MIQGQPFNLEYEIDGCSRVLIIYDNGESIFKRYKIQKSTGAFTSVTNVYAPTIRFLALGAGFKYVDFVLPKPKAKKFSFCGSVTNKLDLKGDS